MRYEYNQFGELKLAKDLVLNGPGRKVIKSKLLDVFKQQQPNRWTFEYTGARNLEGH